MISKCKRLFGAAAILLLLGAGCAPAVKNEVKLETGTEAEGTGEMQDNGKMDIDIDASSSLDASVDVAVDAALSEADTDAMLEFEENADADVMTSDSVELDAYGNTYDKTQF